MDWNVVIGAAGVIISVVTWYAGQQFGRRQEAGVNEWRQEVRAWAAECIDVLTESAIPPAAPDGEHERVLRVRTSALVDRGRLFFTNEGTADGDGPEKPTAFRGSRPSVLDHLVAAYQLHCGAPLPAGVARDRTFVELRKAFVSELQEILQPGQHNRLIHEAIHGAAPKSGALSERQRRGAEAVLQEAIVRVQRHSSKHAA
jgi:hypothetical protein